MGTAGSPRLPMASRQTVFLLEHSYQLSLSTCLWGISMMSQPIETSGLTAFRTGFLCFVSKQELLNKSGDRNLENTRAILVVCQNLSHVWTLFEAVHIPRRMHSILPVFESVSWLSGCAVGVQPDRYPLWPVRALGSCPKPSIA